jgi:spoIIIJ-associated protein
VKKVVVNAKTVEEAVNMALTQLGTTKEKVKVTVLEQPTKGLFGLIGGKHAQVEVEMLSVEDENESIVDHDPIEKAKLFLENVLKTMNLDVTIDQTEVDDYVSFNLVGPSLGMIIGRRGQTLDSLQYLVNIVANRKNKDHLRIVLDAENYRKRRQQTLEGLANRLANRVIKTQKEVVLEPMNPLERKIIHSQLQNHPKVSTVSKGDEPNRKVVIALKKD